MLKRYALFISLFICSHVRAQPPEDKAYYSVHISGTHDYLIGGFVYVKESYLPADTLSFRQQLKMSHWNSAAVSLSRTFKNRASVTFSAENFYFDGASWLNRTVLYNSLVLNGYNEISIDRSKLHRVQIKYQKPVTNVKSDFQLYYDVGLIYDALFFRIDAKVLNDADTSHLVEDFDDQIIPYPLLGVKAELMLNKSRTSLLFTEATGTFIPEGLTFFHRQGDINYRYYSLNTALGYEYRTGRLSLSPKITYRLLNAKEDEGDHNFFISAGGVSLDLGWRF